MSLETVPLQTTLHDDHAPFTFSLTSGKPMLAAASSSSLGLEACHERRRPRSRVQRGRLLGVDMQGEPGLRRIVAAVYVFSRAAQRPKRQVRAPNSAWVRDDSRFSACALTRRFCKPAWKWSFALICEVTPTSLSLTGGARQRKLQGPMLCDSHRTAETYLHTTKRCSS